jgi:thiol-disulfide isomerase/thioredoxin
MRAICLVLLLAMLSTGATGCALFGKKDSSNDHSGGFAWFKKKDKSSANPPPPKFPDPIVSPPGTPAPSAPTPTAQNAGTAEIASFAGLVVDAYNQPVTNSTYVQLVQLDSVKEAGSPIDIATRGDGYFFIPNLKAGGQYKLIARTKQGEKMLAGIAIRQAPDVHVVIQVKEEFATGSIPPMPSGPDKQDVKPAATSGLNQGTPPVGTWMATPNGNGAAAPTAPAAIDLPAKLSVPTAATTPGIASNQNTPWPPPLSINGGPKKTTMPPTPTTLPSMPSSNAAPNGLAPLVPSCVVVGDAVQILALKDVDDQTWNFHKDRKSKLVLLDFWTRDCVPCRHTMPILTQMHTKLGPQGLEVVGVLLDTGSVRDQALRAKQQCFQLQTNYRQVLGQDEKTRLREQFGLQAFPTLILLDDTGRIVWRHVGTPDPLSLENVLQKRLAASRAF